jgi:hypothetical protein
LTFSPPPAPTGGGLLCTGGGTSLSQRLLVRLCSEFRMRGSKETDACAFLSWKTIWKRSAIS